VTGAHYRLVVRGELDARYASLFEAMAMDRVGGKTVLTGEVVDQAHLHGLIERIEELGLELLEIQRVAATPVSGQETAGPGIAGGDGAG
jgi:hypothetical protein